MKCRRSRADTDGSREPTGDPLLPRHLLTLTALALGALAGAPAAAGASELYAAPGGGDGPACTSSAAPCALSAALLAARAAPGADVVHLAAGTYTSPVSATSASDTDVTLAGAGAAATTIAAAPPGDAPMVQLGSGAGTGTMTIEDLTLDGSGAGTFASALRTRLASLTLRRVTVLQTGATPKQAPAIDADLATESLTLEGVTVAADTQTADGAVGAVNAGGPTVVRDSTITHTSVGDSAALYARGPLSVQRSTITHGDANLGYALRVVNPDAALQIAMDSSILRGGRSAARFDLGVSASRLAFRGTTFAPAAASTGWSVDVQSSLVGSLAQATVDSSLLIGRSARATNGATLACTFSNVPAGGSGVTCPTTAANAAGNTKLTTAELQLGADLAPLPGSPVVDSGNPAGVAAGESATDLLGRPRAAASDDRCDAGPGRRDKGAFERYRPSPQVAISGPDALAPGAAGTFTSVTSAPGLELHWTFADGGDGGTAATTTHAFAALPSGVTLTARDPRFDCSASATRSIGAAPVAAPAPGPAAAAAAVPDRTAPSVKQVRLDATRVRLPRGTIHLRLTLSEAATITLTVGRAKGSRIVAPRRIVVRGARGANTIALKARTLKLRRGRYAVRIAVRDAAGNAARPETLKFSAR